jgi:preprotein translocase subunit YajC
VFAWEISRGRACPGGVDAGLAGSACGETGRLGAVRGSPGLEGPFDGLVAILAQQQGPRSPLESVLQFAPLLAVAFLAWMLLYRPERQRQAEAEKLRMSLKRNDRVVTAAGIYGTVSAVDRDAGRVTLKIDDSSNVKLDVTLASIVRVIGEPARQEPSGA